jgi:AP-1 complex subunit mu
VAVARGNPNVLMILYFLQKLVEVLAEYFDGLEDESMRDNFVVTYELLDEMMDNGYPQISEPKVLQEYIKTESHKLARQDRVSEAQVPIAVSNAVGWRPEGIKHGKNEIFLDVIEKLNLLVPPSRIVGLLEWQRPVLRDHRSHQNELDA